MNVKKVLTGACAAFGCLLFAAGGFALGHYGFPRAAAPAQPETELVTEVTPMPSALPVSLVNAQPLSGAVAGSSKYTLRLDGQELVITRGGIELSRLAPPEALLLSAEPALATGIEFESLESIETYLEGYDS